MAIKAVLFDVGGVVLDSTVPILGEYEKQHGLPPGCISQVVGKNLVRANGPQQRLERGQIMLDEFCRIFDEEFAQQGFKVSTAEVMLEMIRHMVERPQMLAAIDKIREAGLCAAAITNSWETGEPESEARSALKTRFDQFFESCECGMRKPEPKFLSYACQHLGVDPAEVVYLDEAGTNLKPGQKLGMTTIKVTEPAAALRELEGVLGISLLEAEESDDE